MFLIKRCAGRFGIVRLLAEPFFYAKDNEMKLLDVDTLQTAGDKVIAAINKKKPKTIKIDITEALGMIAAEDIKAKDNIPCFTKSTVDGYAVIASDTNGTTDSIPAFFNIVESISMGKVPERSIKNGETSYVPTGGMLPEGANAVVMIEHSEKFASQSVALYDSVSPGRNVILEGEDTRSGEVIISKGSKIRPQEIGVLASSGVKEIEVFKPWKVTVISTGDEIIDINTPIEKAKTRDINTYSVAASAEKYGMKVVRMPIVKDDRESLNEAISKAMNDSDVIALSGGSSKGEKDYTAEAIDSLTDGGVFTHGIAIKPGKPTILGYDEKSETLFAGLPGHPMAAMVIFELIIGGAYKEITGQRKSFAIPATLSENVPSAGGRATFMPVRILQNPDGTYTAEPILGKSGLMKALAKADGYIMMDTDSEGKNKGEQVQVTLFD